MTNYKRYDTITAGELRKMGGRNAVLKKNTGTIYEGVLAEHLDCIDFYIIDGRGGIILCRSEEKEEKDCLMGLERIEIEQPEEDHIEEVHEKVGISYGGKIEKINRNKNFTLNTIIELEDKIDELIDTVNKQQEVINDLVTNK